MSVSEVTSADIAVCCTMHGNVPWRCAESHTESNDLSLDENQSISNII